MYVTNVGINVYGEPLNATVNTGGPSRTDVLEALFDSAVSSGTLAEALGTSNFSLLPPTASQVRRSTRIADRSGAPFGCASSMRISGPLSVPPPPLPPIWPSGSQAACGSSSVDKRITTYEAVMIAFIVSTGCCIFSFVAGMTYTSMRLKLIQASTEQPMTQLTAIRLSGGTQAATTEGPGGPTRAGLIFRFARLMGLTRGAQLLALGRKGGEAQGQGGEGTEIRLEQAPVGEQAPTSP